MTTTILNYTGDIPCWQWVGCGGGPRAERRLPHTAHRAPLTANRYRLSATGYRLLSIGYRLLAASSARSATRRRTSRMRSLFRVGYTRLVRRMTNRSWSGSTQMDVPVKPVCPNAWAERRSPALEFSLGVSQPSARLEKPGRSTRVNSAMVAELMSRRPLPGPRSGGVASDR